MKIWLLTILPLILIVSSASYARTVEVEVYGMTCAFCVDNLTRQFNKMESVSKVDVSLKLKKIHLETDEELPTIETINQAIIDAGFTPVKVTILPDEKE
ncbi:MAG: heavy-metal-associated domain-containing protein [Methylophaga sp.]|nr:heavy-metal-associated domain-containing protein [Methylophaga sp.]